MLGSTNSTTINNRNTNATFTENGTYIPTEEYTGFSVVTVDVPSADEAIRKQAYTFTPSKIDTNVEDRYQWDEYAAPFKVELSNALDVVDDEIIDQHPELIPELVPDLGEEWKGLGRIKIRKVGSWIDSEISRDNILVGHTILGVGGTVIQNNPNPDPIYVTPRYGDPTTYISIKPDGQYNGLSEVRVNYMKEPDPYVPKLYNPGEINITWGETRYITRPSGYDGLENLTINGPELPTKKNLEIEPAIYEQVEKADEHNVYGFNEVKVNAVTSSIDENIKPENIRLGVTILGVEGGYLPETLETIRVTPRTIPQSIQAGGNYDAIGLVNVAAVTSSIDSDIIPENIKQGIEILGVEGTYTGARIQDTVTVKPEIVAKTVIPDENYEALKSVIVEGVDKTIDENIKPENILKGKTILGVEGTVLPNSLQLQAEKTVSPTQNQQVILPDSGYDALVKLIIKAVTNEIDPNIIAENIKNNITILGVTGTFRGENDYWIDLANLKGVSTLGNKTFGEGQPSQTDYEITKNNFTITEEFIENNYLPIENIGAALFSISYGLDNTQVTDPILQQLYIYVKGGFYYSDYTSYMSLKDQIYFIYPFENEYGINGCLLDYEDTGSEKTLIMSVITGLKEPKIILSQDVLSKNNLPEGYNNAIYVKEITIPAHKVFRPVNSENVINEGGKGNIFVQPVLISNGTLGGETFAVASSSIYNSSYPAWKAMDSDSNSYWHSANASSGTWYTFYNPSPIVLEAITMKINGNNCMNNYTILGSNDNVIWQEIQNGTCNYSGTVTIIIDKNNQKSFKYFRLVGNNFPYGYWLVYNFTLQAHHQVISEIDSLIDKESIWLLDNELQTETEITLLAPENSESKISEKEELTNVSEYNNSLILTAGAIDLEKKF